MSGCLPWCIFRPEGHYKIILNIHDFCNVTTQIFIKKFNYFSVWRSIPKVFLNKGFPETSNFDWDVLTFFFNQKLWVRVFLNNASSILTKLEQPFFWMIEFFVSKDLSKMFVLKKIMILRENWRNESQCSHQTKEYFKLNVVLVRKFPSL